MKRPILGVQMSVNFSQALQMILEFHLFPGAEIIDPTPGEKHSWKYYLAEIKKSSFFPPMKFNISFIKDNIALFTETKKHIKEKGAADAIFYDPPYIFGTKTGTDIRREDYGEYDHSFQDIKDFLIKANQVFPKFLKESGLVFLKYTDVFSLQDRRFYFCAALWPPLFSNFEVVDHYIIPHHHVSPTAWQVKNRPCGIVNYTYLTVLRRRKNEN